MRLFLLTFFLLYGGMHLYAFLKAKAAFAFNVQTGIVVALIMLVMIFAPVIVRQSEKAGHESFAQIMSYIGYMWLGILFLFISASLVLDCYRMVVYLINGFLNKPLFVLTITPQYAFFIPLTASLLIVFYGYFEAKDIRTETIRIESSKLPAEIQSLRIVQISDVHLGLIVREERLGRILAAVKKTDPDILVSTGDFVDGQIDNLAGLADMLASITPKYGKFAITGNHEYYAGLDQALQFTEKAGFKILRGKALNVENIINVAGVDDPQAKSFSPYREVSEKELLSRLPREYFTLLLKHRPFVDNDSIGHFDLQLSGHVHRGQIFPFSIITGLYYKARSGLNNLPGNSMLYLSRGSGTWGPPIRFLSPPEITVIDLVHKNR
jgi:uncharacterized protein